SVDVLFAVNAIHNGGDLGAALASLRAVLASDGFLVISESLCSPRAHFPQAFVFTLPPLPSHGISTASRFFSAAVWREALSAAGWRAEIHVNSEGLELALLHFAKP